LKPCFCWCSFRFQCISLPFYFYFLS
jgi:hypothetical protein